MKTMISCLLLVSVLISSTAASSAEIFTNNFREPDPPNNIVAEYQASYVQHKWDNTGISHISSGMIYASLALGRLRMDVIYEGNIASSLFDYSKMNPDGTVPNYIYTLSPSTATKGLCTFYNVTPAFPLFRPDILAQSQATYAGMIDDDLFYAKKGRLQEWDIIFGSSTGVKAFIDSSNTLVRMDFYSPFRSTFTTTRLFDIRSGSPDPKYFANPCPIDAPVPGTSGARRSI